MDLRIRSMWNYSTVVNSGNPAYGRHADPYTAATVYRINGRLYGTFDKGPYPFPVADCIDGGLLFEDSDDDYPSEVGSAGEGCGL